MEGRKRAELGAGGLPLGGIGHQGLMAARKRAQPAIEFSNFSFSYKSGRRALDRVSLLIGQGEFVALMGETGSGKSTLLLSLNGIVPSMTGGKTGGRLFVMGKEPSREGVKNMSRLVSIVFQNPDDQIFAGTVLEETTFGPLNHGACWRDAERAANAALAKVGLAGFEGRDPSELSFGQRQKVAFASALAMGTPIMAFDEPVSGMDYKSARGIYSILEMLHKEGRTIIVVEHSDYVHSLAGRFVLMKDGQMAAQGGRKVLSSAIAKELGMHGAVHRR